MTPTPWPWEQLPPLRFQPSLPFQEETKEKNWEEERKEGEERAEQRGRTSRKMAVGSLPPALPRAHPHLGDHGPWLCPAHSPGPLLGSSPTGKIRKRSLHGSLELSKLSESGSVSSGPKHLTGQVRGKGHRRLWMIQ